jgi:hypothetical protein
MLACRLKRPIVRHLPVSEILPPTDFFDDSKLVLHYEMDSSLSSAQQRSSFSKFWSTGKLGLARFVVCDNRAARDNLC